MKHFIPRTMILALLLTGTFLQACHDTTIFPYRGHSGDSSSGTPTTLGDLEGVTWKLVGFETSGSTSGDVSNAVVALQNVPAGQVYTLTLENGKASGKADCKGYNYSYKYDEDDRSISFFDPGPQIMMYCGDASVDQKFYNALQTAYAFEATTKTLYIYYGEKDGSTALYFVRDDGNGGNDGGMEVTEGKLQFGLERIRLTESTPYRIDDAIVKDDMLFITVGYGGGCAEHQFDLYGNSEVGSGEPTPYAMLLHHNGNGDMCEAYITRKLSFNLSELRAKWMEQTGKSEGTIEISLSDGHSGEVRKIFYVIGKSNSGGGVSDLPSWLNDTIAAIKSRPVANPPESFYVNKYNGQVVYYRPQICCDIPSVLYSAEGKVICSPDGGFTGKGDGRCPDYVKIADNGELVWKDPR